MIYDHEENGTTLIMLLPSEHERLRKGETLLRRMGLPDGEFEIRVNLVPVDKPWPGSLSELFLELEASVPHVKLLTLLTRMVCTAKSHEADRINKEGEVAQVEYLLSVGNPGELERTLRTLKDL